LHIFKEKSEIMISADFIAVLLASCITLTLSSKTTIEGQFLMHKSFSQHLKNLR